MTKLKGEEKLPFYFIKLGRWWEKSEEVDIVAIDLKDNLLIGECKWTSSPVGQKVLTKMMDLNTQIMPDSKSTWFYILSKSGFKKRFIR